MKSLHFSLIQADLVWEDKQANFHRIENMLAAEPPSQAGVIVLPEMFNTGFSLNPLALSEPMDGPTMSWMKKIAKQYGSILCGSAMIEDEGKYFNRFIWMQPDGIHYYYDKRHLFSYAGEQEHFTAGEKRLVVQVGGWRICLMICYDLRFPVWARNQAKNAYDVLLYVANWPKQRAHAWEVLLAARAIENQAYVVGVNRVGQDGNSIIYQGGSTVINALGEIICAAGALPSVNHCVLQQSDLMSARRQFPFLQDGDIFLLP